MALPEPTEQELTATTAKVTTHPCLMQLAVETVFLEAANQLVAPGSSGLSGRQAEALERLAFDWALNAETYVEPKFGELTKSRERVSYNCIDNGRLCNVDRVCWKCRFFWT